MLKDKLTELGYSAAWRGVRALPEPAAAGLFRRIADRVARKNGRGVRQLRANLRRVVGADVGADELDALI
ncbi:MAG: phosphatidylinositol mannoside acyltransferase, partial [Stackebrandtia sp.]